MNPFSVSTIDNFPRLYKNGQPVFPMFFWQSEVVEPDASAFRAAGIEIFTCFRSGPYYEHPYWVGENQYDFSWYDQKIDEFFLRLPDAYLIPRIFVCAPYWWLEEHPEELCGFAGDPPRIRGIGGGSTFHESYASERWKNEQGEAFRQLIRHLITGPHGDRIIGIHVAGGTCGEWHYWYAKDDCPPDCGPAMTTRYGKPIPPPEQWDAEFFDCCLSASVDAVDHFCRIVKEESDYLTIAFFGYLPEFYPPDMGHRGIDKFLALESVDIVAAPHSYRRRQLGQDGYFRAYTASVAKHGKLFIDEADDRTPLGSRCYAGPFPIMAETPCDAINMLRREFGNVLTHGVGMWYMDIDGGMFRDQRYITEIANLRCWGERSLALPLQRVSEVALVIDPADRLRLPPGRIFDWLPELQAYVHQLPEFCRAGAPFDLYAAVDLIPEVLQKYRVIVILDGITMSESARMSIRCLQKDGRAFIWFYGAGSRLPQDTGFSGERMEELTGIHFEIIAEQRMPRENTTIPNARGFLHEDTARPGFKPLNAMVDQGNFKSYYFGVPEVSAAQLREIYKDNGVFIYNETDDVLSVSKSALMLHASSSGVKTIHLPHAMKVTDMLTGCEIGRRITSFSLPLEIGDTALYELLS